MRSGENGKEDPSYEAEVEQAREAQPDAIRPPAKKKWQKPSIQRLSCDAPRVVRTFGHKGRHTQVYLVR